MPTDKYNCNSNNFTRQNITLLPLYGFSMIECVCCCFLIKQSPLLLSPLGRVDFVSEASKRRERFLIPKMLRPSILVALQTSIVLTFISFRQATSPRRWTPPLRQASSATFAYAADAPLLSLCDIFPVSSGTFTRFIGRACPKGESKKS